MPADVKNWTAQNRIAQHKPASLDCFEADIVATSQCMMGTTSVGILPPNALLETPLTGRDVTSRMRHLN